MSIDKAIEDSILVHRYLYYVECNPIISDFEYDVVERDARDRLPPESPVHDIGSDMEDSYPDYIRTKALKILRKKRDMDL
jgi:NAD-dependent DNA ligase